MDVNWKLKFFFFDVMDVNCKLKFFFFDDKNIILILVNVCDWVKNVVFKFFNKVILSLWEYFMFENRNLREIFICGSFGRILD